MKILLIMVCLILSSHPQEFSFESNYIFNLENNFKSNTIIDIESLNDSIILSSSGGLGYSNFIDSNFAFNSFQNENLPSGGNPSMIVKDNIIVVSGSATVLDLGSYYPSGTGVSYSIDAGATWQFMPQPLDDMPSLWSCSKFDYENLFFNSRSECELSCIGCDNEQGTCARLYDYISWGDQDNIAHLSITTPINNVTYDLDINGDYVYSTSWAGGLRRFDYTLENPLWESVPLPMDDQEQLICGSINLNAYQLNPVGDCDNDSDNHKPFSVFSYDNTIWVGTAGGLNKGTISDNCIDWTHMKSFEYGFYDDWIIDIDRQLLSNGGYRMWAITWDKETQGSFGPPSFSDDGGETWSYSNQLVDIGVKSYNIDFSGDNIYLSTDEGLFLSKDGILWESFNSFIEYGSGEQIFSSVVYDSKIINNKLWVGTQDGIAISSDIMDPVWDIFRFWEEASSLSAYPNPFLMDDYNVLNGSGHVRFVFSGTNINSTIDIFNFNMDKVTTLKNAISSNGQIEFSWNGINEFGKKVTNGIYFCRLNDSGNNQWVKLAVLGSR